MKFLTVAEPRNSGKSTKVIHKNRHGRNLTKYTSVQHIWDLSQLMGLFFAVNLKIYFETSSPQWENVPKLPGVLRLLLRKTGHWPVHDIKSFAISTFLSLLLLKEQMMISDKKKNLCKRIPSPNDISKQTRVLSSKSPLLKGQHL